MLAKLHLAVLDRLNAEANEDREKPKRAVTISESLASKSHIISMIDGRPYRTLRSHIADHGFTPAQYRQLFGLEPDYPMVAPSYSEGQRIRATSARTKGKNGAAP